MSDPRQRMRQEIYLRAVMTIPNLSIHRGRFLASKVRMKLETLYLVSSASLKLVASGPIPDRYTWWTDCVSGYPPMNFVNQAIRKRLSV